MRAVKERKKIMIIKNSSSNFLGIPNSELVVKNYGTIKEVKRNETLIEIPPALFTFLVNFIKKANKQSYVSFKDKDWNYEKNTLQRYAKKINDICKEINVKSIIKARRGYGYYLDVESFLLIE